MTDEFDRILGHFVSCKSNKIWRSNASHYVRKKAPKSLKLRTLLIMQENVSRENLLDLLSVLLPTGQTSIDDITDLVPSLEEEIINPERNLSMDQFFVRLDLLAIEPSLLQAFDPYQLLNFITKSIIASPLCLHKALIILDKINPHLCLAKIQDQTLSLIEMMPQTESFLIELLLSLQTDLSTDHFLLLLDIFCNTTLLPSRNRIFKFFHELQSCRKEELVLAIQDLNDLFGLQCMLLLNPDKMAISKLEKLLEHILLGSSDNNTDTATIKDWELFSSKKRELFLSFAFDFLIDYRNYSFIKSIVFSAKKLEDIAKSPALLPKILELCILNHADENHEFLVKLIRANNGKRIWDLVTELIQKHNIDVFDFFVALIEESQKSWPASLCFVFSFSIKIEYGYEELKLRQLTSCLEVHPALLKRAPVKQFLAEHAAEFFEEASPDLIRQALAFLDLDLEKILLWMAINIEILELVKCQEIVDFIGKKDNLSPTAKCLLKELEEQLSIRFSSLPDPDEELYVTLIEAIEHDHSHVVGYSSCCSECYCD